MIISTHTMDSTNHTGQSRSGRTFIYRQGKRKTKMNAEQMVATRISKSE